MIPNRKIRTFILNVYRRAGAVELLLLLARAASRYQLEELIDEVKLEDVACLVTPKTILIK